MSLLEQINSLETKAILAQKYGYQTWEELISNVGKRNVPELHLLLDELVELSMRCGRLEAYRFIEAQFSDENNYPTFDDIHNTTMGVIDEEQEFLNELLMTPPPRYFEEILKVLQELYPNAQSTEEFSEAAYRILDRCETSFQKLSDEIEDAYIEGIYSLETILSHKKNKIIEVIKAQNQEIKKTPPPSPKYGDKYFNADTQMMCVFNGEIWVEDSDFDHRFKNESTGNLPEETQSS